MGSPVSPIVANLYTEYLEQKALSTAPNPPSFCCRYVDDTFVIHKEVNKQGFLQHINSVDSAIRFTVKDNKRGWVHPLLGHHCQTRGWLHTVSHWVQETHSPWPVLTVGQLPSPLSQILCNPYPLPQGLHSVQQAWAAPTRKGLSQEGSH